MNLLAAGLLVVVPGFLPALALTRRWARGLLMAGVVTIATAGAAAIVCVLLRVPIVPCVVLLFSATNVVAIISIRRTRLGDSERTGPTGGGSLAMLLFGLATIALAWRPPPPLAWDARSIWWFHAAWFEEGGATVVDALRNPIMTFGHPEYPNGVPALVGAAWSVLGGEDLRVAMAITAVLTAMAVALLVSTVFDNVRVDDVMVVVPILLAAAIVMQGGGLAASGYQDVLCACLVAAALVGFVGASGTSTWTAAVVLMAATTTKAEGLYFAVIVAVVAMFFVASRRHQLLVAGIAVAPAVLWLGTVRVLSPDLDTDVRPAGFVRLLLLDGARWSRFGDAIPSVWSEMWPYLIAATLVTAGLGVQVNAITSAPFRLATACLAAGWLTSLGLVAVYAAGVRDMQWWLDTSLDRVVVTPKVLSLVTIAIAVAELGLDRYADHGVHPRTRSELLDASAD